MNSLPYALMSLMLTYSSKPITHTDTDYANCFSLFTKGSKFLCFSSIPLVNCPLNNPSDVDFKVKQYTVQCVHTVFSGPYQFDDYTFSCVMTYIDTQPQSEAVFKKISIPRSEKLAMCDWCAKS